MRRCLVARLLHGTWVANLCPRQMWSVGRSTSFVFKKPHEVILGGVRDVHQSSSQWRGVGIAVSHDLFDCTTDRTSCAFGAAWVVRLKTTKRFVLAALHLPTGVPVAEYYKATAEFRRMLRGWHEDLPCFVGVDANVELLWSRADDREGDVGFGLVAKLTSSWKRVGVYVYKFKFECLDYKIAGWPHIILVMKAGMDATLTVSLFGVLPLVMYMLIRMFVYTLTLTMRDFIVTLNFKKTRGGRWRDGRARWVVDGDSIHEPEN